jgi:hypothetical protein
MLYFSEDKVNNPKDNQGRTIREENPNMGLIDFVINPYITTLNRSDHESDARSSCSASQKAGFFYKNMI